MSSSCMRLSGHKIDVFPIFDGSRSCISKTYFKIMAQITYLIQHSYHIWKSLSQNVANLSSTNNSNEKNIWLFINGGSILLEPIMQVEVVTIEESAPAVMADLSYRRAEIKSFGVRGRNKIIYSLIPLSELLGYSTSLRIIASGNATFTMEFSHYQPMNTHEEQEAIKKVTGF